MGNSSAAKPIMRFFNGRIKLLFIGWKDMAIKVRHAVAMSVHQLRDIRQLRTSLETDRGLTDKAVAMKKTGKPLGLPVQHNSPFGCQGCMLFNVPYQTPR